MSETDRLNVYICQTCGGMICTIDRDQGVTPFMIACQVMRFCSGMMQSQWYPELPPHFSPEYEWYKPKLKKHMDVVTAEHVKKGGLLLRKLEPNRARQFAEQRMKLLED